MGRNKNLRPFPEQTVQAPLTPSTVVAATAPATPEPVQSAPVAPVVQPVVIPQVKPTKSASAMAMEQRLIAYKAQFIPFPSPEQTKVRINTFVDILREVSRTPDVDVVNEFVQFCLKNRENIADEIEVNKIIRHIPNPERDRYSMLYTALMAVIQAKVTRQPLKLSFQAIQVAIKNDTVIQVLARLIGKN